MDPRIESAEELLDVELNGFDLKVRPKNKAAGQKIIERVRRLFAAGQFERCKNTVEGLEAVGLFHPALGMFRLLALKYLNQTEEMEALMKRSDMQEILSAHPELNALTTARGE